jgi:hypothetical protein
MVMNRKLTRKEGFDLTSRLMSDMDPQLLEFLKITVNTFVKWDLAHFFHDNPSTLGSADDIARYMGRSAEMIRDELVEMARAGLLRRERLGGTAVYSLSLSRERRAMLEQFAEACHDQQFRVKAIYHLVRGMR